MPYISWAFAAGCGKVDRGRIDKRISSRYIQRRSVTEEIIFSGFGGQGIVLAGKILGEAASRISEDLRKQHPEIPWGQMIGLRNNLVHGYFGIKSDLVWAVVERDLPPLKSQLQCILSDLE